MEDFFVYLKSATNLFNVLLACTRPLVTEFADIVKKKWFENYCCPVKF